MSQPLSSVHPLPAVIPLSTIILNYVKHTHDEFHELIDTRLTYNNGVILDEQQRRKILIEFFNNKAKQSIRLLTIIKWCQQHGNTLELLQQFYSIVDNKSIEYNMVVDNIKIIQRNIIDSRLYPQYDIDTALHIQYNHGQYKVLPSVVNDGMENKIKFNANEMNTITQRLNQQIHVKLLSTQLPPHIRNIDINNGMCTINVNDELSLCISLRMEPQIKLDDNISSEDTQVKPLTDEQRIKWRLFDVLIHIQSVDTKQYKLVNQHHINILLQQCNTIMYNNVDTPLIEVYQYLHKFTVTLAIDLLCVQSRKLHSTHIKSTYNKHKQLNIQYWNSYKHANGALDIAIDSSNTLTHTHTPTLPHTELLRIDMNNIDIYTLLNTVKHLHAQLLLNKLYSHITKLPTKYYHSVSLNKAVLCDTDIINSVTLQFNSIHTVQIYIDVQTGAYILYYTQQINHSTHVRKLLAQSQLVLNQSIDKVQLIIHQLSIQFELLHIYNKLQHNTQYQLFNNINIRYENDIEKLSDVIYVRYSIYPFIYLAVQVDLLTSNKYHYWLLYTCKLPAAPLIDIVYACVNITDTLVPLNTQSSDVLNIVTLFQQYVPQYLLSSYIHQLRRILTGVYKSSTQPHTLINADFNDLTCREHIVEINAAQLFNTIHMSHIQCNLVFTLNNKHPSSSNGVNGHTNTNVTVYKQQYNNALYCNWSYTLNIDTYTSTQHFTQLNNTSILSLADTIQSQLILHYVTHSINECNHNTKLWYNTDELMNDTYPPQQYFSLQNNTSNTVILQYNTSDDTTSTIKLTIRSLSKQYKSMALLQSLMQPDQYMQLQLSFTPIPFLNQVQLEQYLNENILLKPQLTLAELFRLIYISIPVMPLLYKFIQQVHSIDQQNVIHHLPLNLYQNALQYSVISTAESINVIRLSYKHVARCKLDIMLYSHNAIIQDYQNDRIRPFTSDYVNKSYTPIYHSHQPNMIDIHTLATFLQRWYYHAAQTDITRRLIKLHCNDNTIQLRNCTVKFHRESVSKIQFNSLSNKPVYTVEIINNTNNNDTNHNTSQPPHHLTSVDIQSLQHMFHTQCFTLPYSSIALYQLLSQCEWKYELLKHCITLYQLQYEIYLFLQNEQNQRMSTNINQLYCIISCTTPLQWHYTTDTQTNSIILYILIALQNTSDRYNDILYLPLAYNIHHNTINLWYIDRNSSKCIQPCPSINSLLTPPTSCRNAVKQLVKLSYSKLIQAAVDDGAAVNQQNIDQAMIQNTNMTNNNNINTNHITVQPTMSTVNNNITVQ